LDVAWFVADQQFVVISACEAVRQPDWITFGTHQTKTASLISQDAVSVEVRVKSRAPFTGSAARASIVSLQI
jgi:hypothetical protein